MPQDRDLRARLDERDRVLRRMRTLTAALVVGTTALAGAFAGLAAHTMAGRKAARTALQPKAVLTAARRGSTPIPPPPPLPAAGSDYTPAPSAPAQAPAVAASPPVVVSGGS